MGKKRAYLRFYAELNDFLDDADRFRTLERSFDVEPSVKDMIESAGIPHTEVDLIVANGESVDFTYRVQDRDRISVYPVFESFDITPALRLRPTPLRETRFVLDANLGHLARYLRLLGFDTAYRNDFLDAELARISVEQRRILLTRDRGLLKRGEITHGYYVRATSPRDQVAEVVDRFDLAGAIVPFRRCLQCNGELRPIGKEDVAHRLPANTARHFDEFRICSECNQVYWKGSHYERMAEFVEELRTRRHLAE